MVGGGDNWTRFTKNEQYTLVSLWTIFQSPLIYGGTLPDIDPFTLGLFTNEDILEMHSSLDDRREIFRNNDWFIWSGKSEADQYFVYFNVSERVLQISNLSTFMDECDYLSLWENKVYSNDSLKSIEVQPHGACVLKRLKKS